jgi:enoyl-CoA hydratase
MTEIRVDRDGAVAVITLAAPERRNALTEAMSRELIAACDEVDSDPSVGAVVVRADGPVFCAGGDRALLRAAGRDATDDATLKGLQAVYQSFVRIGQLEAPTIAAVRGAAVGAGVNLVFATDLRIMGLGAKLIAGFLRIGVHPGGGHFTLAGRLAGRETTAALTLFGEEIDGARAAELALAWQVLPDDEVETRALELASRAATDPELARLATRSMRQELGPPGIPWSIALDSEIAPQLWSLRRALKRGLLG